MADFCFQCALALFFPPPGDFAHFGERGALTAEDTARGNGMVVLCEGCGMICVDHLGRCMGGCDEGHVPPDQDEVLQRHEQWLARRLGPLGWAYRLRDWWMGTPWEPGQRHYLRWRLNDWLDGRVDAEFDDHG